MADPEQRSRDLERAATCMAHDPSCAVTVNIGATVNAIADALAAARREVWQRVLDLNNSRVVGYDSAERLDAILRAAAEGAKS